MIGALLAIFGHLVVSIALNLQVSLRCQPGLAQAEEQQVSQACCLLAAGPCLLPESLHSLCLLPVPLPARLP